MFFLACAHEQTVGVDISVHGPNVCYISATIINQYCQLLSSNYYSVCVYGWQAFRIQICKLMLLGVSSLNGHILHIEISYHEYTKICISYDPYSVGQIKFTNPITKNRQISET
jgi:hypothetical protein